MADGFKIRKSNSQFPKDFISYTTQTTITPPIATATIDVFLVGGGGGKGKDNYQSGVRYSRGWGGGGGSGYITQQLGIPCTHEDTLLVEIGASGTNGTTSTAGTNGGATKIYKNGTLIASANGGNAGGASVWSGGILSTCGNGGSGASGGGAGGQFMYYDGSLRCRSYGGDGGSEGAGGNPSTVVYKSGSYASKGSGGSGSGTTTRVFGINDGILTASGHYGVDESNTASMISTGYGDGQGNGAVFIRYNRA